METVDASLQNRSIPITAQKFVAEAEQAFNAKDIESTCAVYTKNAQVEFWTDGIRDKFVGIDEIRRGWWAAFRAMPNFSLKKKITLADHAIIINEWIGSVEGGQKQTARGIEVWCFNEPGQVSRHRLYSFLRVYEADAWRGKVHFGLAQPAIGIRMEKERLRLRRRRAKTS